MNIRLPRPPVFLPALLVSLAAFANVARVCASSPLAAPAGEAAAPHSAGPKASEPESSSPGRAEPAVAPMPAVDARLVSAVLEHRLLTFTYHGHDRVVEPHLYGVAPGGEVLLHGYQTSFGGVSAKPPGWRTFAVKDLKNIGLDEGGFAGAREGYTAARPRLATIWAEISSSQN